MTKEIDIEEINIKLDNHIQKKFIRPTNDDIIKYTPMIIELLNDTPFITLKRKYSYSYKNSFLYHIFLNMMFKNPSLYTSDKHEKIRNILKIKIGKTQSGIISVTVFTSPYPEYIDDNGENVVQSFTCQWNCHYCPNEPGQPRSYLKGEPGVLRANREMFDCVKQMYARMEALFLTGHSIDKLEVLVLGGTWTSYPIKYRNQFINDIYYAANTFHKYIKNVILNENSIIRDKFSLAVEKDLNKTSISKIIGLTLETRPDTIEINELHNFRLYGCTRIQLGIQHIDDNILNIINRKCTTRQSVLSLLILKNCCYKIDIHIMPNLPGSSYSIDDNMFDKFLGVYSKIYKIINNDYWEIWDLKYPELQADQWKIYPTTITPFTEIKKWFDNGSYIPYSNDELYNLLYKTKSLIFPWIRLNRCIRDISGDYVYQEDYTSNMREIIQKEMKLSGISCQCIRCREAKTDNYDYNNSITVIRQYNASNGTEYFISRETIDKKTIYGFIRLRLVKNNFFAKFIFPEISESALIRELHVYGELQTVNSKNKNYTQHKGIGKLLLKKAEEIAKKNEYKTIAVISGEGTRNYYSKLGYNNISGPGYFMIKYL